MCWNVQRNCHGNLALRCARIVGGSNIVRAVCFEGDAALARWRISDCVAWSVLGIHYPLPLGDYPTRTQLSSFFHCQTARTMDHARKRPFHYHYRFDHFRICHLFRQDDKFGKFLVILQMIPRPYGQTLAVKRPKFAQLALFIHRLVQTF